MSTTTPLPLSGKSALVTAPGRNDWVRCAQVRRSRRLVASAAGTPVYCRDYGGWSSKALAAARRDSRVPPNRCGAGKDVDCLADGQHLTAPKRSFGGAGAEEVASQNTRGAQKHLICSCLPHIQALS
jgi:hypothetical protein